MQGSDWPTWRYDAARSGACPQELPAELHLQWVRQLAAPRPAWPASQDRLQFDASYEPVVAGKTIFIGSMVSDSVTAYDTGTGAEKWRFYTDGPVRFAPVVYKDKLYVACDDGCLYCLNADTGALIRKFRGGPAGNKVLGNDRLISTWPARGGPVLYDRTIYFAAGIWPFMGTFIHALDAETGKVLWTNSGSGPTYLMQPHSSPAFAGVAPQGYLVATDDKLLISGGRSVPAAYDRKTGQFLYYHLNQYGKAGTCEVMASDRYFFNCGALHSLSDGYEVAKMDASIAAGDSFFSADNDTITASQFEPGQKTAKPKTLWRAKLPFEIGKIHLKAGSRLYCSSKDQAGVILAVNIPGDDAKAEVSWQTKVDDKVWSILAADEKLFVVTLEGGLYCFAGEKTEPKRHERQVKSLSAGSQEWNDKVRQILETTGKKEGYCLLLGLGTGEFLAELINQSKLHVIALDPSAEKVAAIRRKLEEAGLYGIRAAAHVGDVTMAQLPPYMADLVVSEDLDAAGLEKGDVFIERVFHSLRPYGGTACFSAPQEKQVTILKRASELNLPGCTTMSSDNFFILTRAGALPGSAAWTHQYADSANTVMSRDKSVKAPLGLLWFGGPSNDKVLPRHGHGPSPQVVGGRLFIEGRNMLRAVDVYTGRLIWERQFQDLGAFYDNTDHQPGANEIGSNYVTVSDGVYVVYGDTIHVLDPATGETAKEFSLPGEDKPRWGALLVWEDLLLATASPLNVPLKDSHGRKLPANAKPLIDKGAEWQYLAGSHPKDGWMSVDFNAESWKTSAAGFGSSAGKTVLKDMKGRYSVVYIRTSFNVPDPRNVPELGLIINYKDGFIAYLNGQEVLRVGVTSGRGAKASGVEPRKSKGSQYFKIDNPGSFLREGTNVLAIEGHNEKVANSGFILDPYLVVLPEANSEAKKADFADLTSISGVTVNADYASASKVLLAMDRHSGQVLWKRDARYSFRHNAIAAAAGKIFCIDGMSEGTLATFKRRGINPRQERILYALDGRTGEPLWKANDDIFGTWLAYAAEYDILLEASSRSGDRATDEADSKMTVYRGSDGKVFWRTDDSYKGPPILYHEWIITQTGGANSSAAAEAKAYDLLTGKTITHEHPMTGQTIPWTWVRFKGCNTAIASENLLTFRSASGAFVDLTRGRGTASLGGFKSGCTSNLIIADGVLNAPDYTRTCVCSYQNQASLALVHDPENEYWTFDYYPSPDEPAPVKRVGINFGAPGNRTTDSAPPCVAKLGFAEQGNGTLWLEFPSVGGPSPDIPVQIDGENLKWFRLDSSLVEGAYNWVTASGVTGLREARIRMFIQPGRNGSNVDAFDKHIGKIPTWSDDQIKGAFEEPRLYTVRLFFAETEEGGRRVFNVSLQDKVVLEAFDIAKDAGGTNRTVIKEFKGVSVKDDLKVNLTPAAQSQNDPLLCGIEIIAEGW